ncbi:hypothetical protein [Neochlamydia sp. AcF84]|uniref:hypothetical protein n=1 Tax=Neochlamydia sp. AcF84 TaxID=2315858 RepID=UPI00140BB05E|nr:hypothetical protein [Neochlamydia sp. AcF84]
MTSGNITGQSQGGGVYLPPSDSGAVPAAGANPAAKAVAQPNQAYYTDSTSTGKEAVSAKHTRNLLAHIPPPNAQAAGVSESSGTGNPFLRPNPLVAFFMNFTEISNVLRQMTMAQEKITLSQMSMINELAKGQAQQILQAAEKESKMYMASAIACFMEAGVSLGQAAMQFRVNRNTDKEMELQKKTYKDEATRLKGHKASAKQYYDEVSGQHTASEMKVKQMRDADKNVADARKNLKDAKQGGSREGITASEQKLKDAEAQRDIAYGGQLKVDQRAAKLKEAEAESLRSSEESLSAKRDLNRANHESETANYELEKFNTSYFMTHANSVSNKMMIFNMTSTMLNKSTEGLMNLWKSELVVEKAQAEALKAMMDAYIQNAFKTVDLMNNAKSENSKLIADLMQQLRKFSEDERKLGSSVGVQSTG